MLKRWLWLPSGEGIGEERRVGVCKQVIAIVQGGCDGNMISLERYTVKSMGLEVSGNCREGMPCCWIVSGVTHQKDSVERPVLRWDTLSLVSGQLSWRSLLDF